MGPIKTRKIFFINLFSIRNENLIRIEIINKHAAENISKNFNRKFHFSGFYFYDSDGNFIEFDLHESDNGG